MRSVQDMSLQSPPCTDPFAAAMGQHPTEEELFQMISEVDENASGSIGAC